MSTVENYQKAKCAQINFDDGSRALISYGETDIRVFKLGFLSIPTKTIHIFNSGFLYSLNNKIGYDLSKDVVKILADELAKTTSIEDVGGACLELEKNKDFIGLI